MEKIVYILGAGFSAPLGLPVMSNFLEKSKDQYFAHPEKYAHFKDIFDKELPQVHVAAGHYQTNAFNIEDILSILEFRARLDNSGDGEQRLEGFKRYLKDVIEFHTPVQDLQRDPNVLFSHANKWNKYTQFVAAIMHCQFRDTRGDPLVKGFDNISHIFADFEPQNYQYSVISFNYDLVLESIQSHLEAFQSKRRFCRSATLGNPRNEIHLAKLHGSIDGDIIPPTWNKGLNPQIFSDWKVAYKVLSEANQIRILGYSLPVTDTYFKYLLRATIIDAPNLKQIDVICKDPTGSVQKAYDEFVKYPNYRFLPESIEYYINDLTGQYPSNNTTYFRLEERHKLIFS